MSRGGVINFRGDRLKDARIRRGWSLAELGACASCNTNSLSRFERGTASPTPPVLVRLARALDVEVTVLAPTPARPTLRDYRERSGRLANDLAATLGVTATTVSTAERGISRPRRTAEWAAVYGLGEEEFINAWERSREAYTAQARRKPRRE